MSPTSIAIDGPSGAGKSTIAKYIATKIGYVYIDTGAMYRAVGVKAVNLNIDPMDAVSVSEMIKDINITISYDSEGQRVFLDSVDVTDKLRTPEVSLAASHVAVIPAVRLKLVELQRELAKTQNVVMDGRDIGTYVLPDAKIKIYLTASVDDRANRRFIELQEKGLDVLFEEIKKDMEFRDANDSSREFAPLKPAEDAILVDTSGNSLEQSISLIQSIIEGHL